MHLPQSRLERLLGERARELGAIISRGHEVTGVSQDDATVAADVRGPDGPYRVTARYLAGCDGAHSRVRDMAGIRFPGTTYPEVNRLAQVAGDAAHQFPATGIGINFGMLDAVNLAWKLAAVIGGWAPADLLDTYHSERHFAGARALLQTQAQVALRRGQDPAAQALRELFLELLADEQPLRRLGALIAGTSIRYPMPGPGQHALTGTFAPDLTLHTGQRTTTSVAELMHAARPVLVDLADRPDLRRAARDWQPRIDICTAQTDHRPADALLIRPDAHIAWAAATGEPAGTAAPALREALSRWFGTPRNTTLPAVGRPS